MNAARAAVFALLPAAVALIAGARALDGGFVRDDRVYVAENPSVVSDQPSWLGLFAEPLAPHAEPPLGLWRPLAVVSWRLDRMRGGSVERPRPFHVTNLLLNAAATSIFALLLLRLGVPGLVAAGAAALFGAHPARSEAVLWISGRSELLMTLFALLASWAALLAPSRWKGPFAALFAVASFASKEQGAALVVVLPFLPHLSRAERLKVATWIAAAISATFVWRGYVLGGTGPSAPGAQVLQDVDTLVGRVPYGLFFLAGYARLLVRPFPLINEYDDPVPPFPPVTLALGAAVAILIVVALFFTRRAPLLAFGAALFGATLAPTLNVVYRTGETFAERFLCLPTAGAALALAVVAARRPRLGGPFLAALALLAGARTAERARDWTSQRALAEAAVRDAPHVGGSWHMLAADRIGDGGDGEVRPDDLVVAAEALEKSARLAPHRAPVTATLAKKRLREGLGSPYTKEGRAAFEEALKLFDAALSSDPSMRDVRASRGRALLGLGRVAEAETAFRDALAVHPDDYFAATDLAALLDGAGRVVEARGVRESALAEARTFAAARPRELGVWRAIAHLHLELGRHKDAEDALRFAVEKSSEPGEKTELSLDLLQFLTGAGRKAEGELAVRALEAAFETELGGAHDPPRRRALLSALGRLAAARGDVASARARYTEARRLAHGPAARRLDAAIRALD
jgi:protein O-mannosyl-transferase